MNLKADAVAHGVRFPAVRTLETYGLTLDEWLAILQRQSWKCPICDRANQKWNTDHDHVPGWKKMPPEERKTHVRGILCWYCNHRVLRDLRDAKLAQRVADYLAAYEERRHNDIA